MKRGLKHILLWLALAALLALLTGAALAETYEHNYHYENCTSRGVCAIGGEPYMGNLRHSIDCGNLGVCQFCGEKVVATVDTHRGPFRWEFDRQKHWQVCLNCGEECFFMEHYVGCRTPGVCMDCGGPTDEPVRSHGDFNQATEYDLDHHWVICTICGDTLEGPFEHVPYPENPSLCGVCGASLKVSLEGADISTNNPLNKLAIYRNGQLVDYTGFAKFDGEDFYFVHGVIDETKTGVVKLLDTWYAFDYGRVMREDMMVPFEGGCSVFITARWPRGRAGCCRSPRRRGAGGFCSPAACSSRA